MTVPYSVLSTDSASMSDFPVWMEAGGTDAPISFDAIDLRFLLDAACPTSGVCDPSSMNVTPHSPSNLTVNVAAGSAVISGGAVGKYLVRGFGSVNVDVPASSGATYLHRLIAEVLDARDLSGTAYGWRYRIVQGTTANVLPATPANAISLAQIRVASGQTGLGAADITDLRTPCHHAMGVNVIGVDFGNVPNTGPVVIPWTQVDDDPWHMWSSATPSQINFRPGMSGLWDFYLWAEMTGASGSAFADHRFTSYLAWNGTPVPNNVYGALVNSERDDLIVRADVDFASGSYTTAGMPIAVALAHNITVPTAGAFVKGFVETPGNTSIELANIRLRAHRREWRA